ncbi:MAG: hypothetical protein BZ138_00055 [Methanosphaera sp. rholeuAM270]|nr:MAG: hypothetical protein BZ138_00055 [Methanosphaera sp. rholeuAM270]
MKILKHFILLMLLVLLIGTVSAENIDDTGTPNLSEAEHDSTVLGTDSSTIQTDESTSDKINTGNMKSEEECNVNSWKMFADKVDNVRNSTEDVTITLDEGTFTNTGTIYWESENPIVLTIDGNGQIVEGNENQLFNISEDSSLVLKNIIIRNAYSQEGGVIYNDGTLTVINSTFEYNGASIGGVIYNYAFLTVINSTFNYNEAKNGSAIFCTGSLTVNNSMFNENKAEKDGTIFVSDIVDDVTIVNSSFCENIADYGGAIKITDNLHRNEGNILIDNNIFDRNMADKGAALFLNHATTVSNNRFTNNSVSLHGPNRTTIGGGAVMLNSGDSEFRFNLINNTFLDNKAEKGYGGAICALQKMVLNTSNNIFIGNIAFEGGAIFSENVFTVRNSTFKNGYVDGSGGAIGIKNVIGLDSVPIDESLDLKCMLIENCEFENVSSRHNGGAICFTNVGYASVIEESLVVNNSSFINCNSEFGGAIVELGGYLTVNNSLFEDVTAFESGGVIYSSQTDLNIFKSSFIDYAANADGQIIYCDDGTLFVSESCFYDNIVGGKSDSIYLYESGINIKDSYFNNSESSIYGVFADECSIENTTLNEDRISLNNTDYVTATTYQGMNLEIINQTYTDEIPASFDLRDYGWVTPVRSQGETGACSAFAVMAAIESALLKQTNTECDLSENNMYSTNFIYFKYGLLSYIEGINVVNAVSHAINWIGLIPEEYDTYDELGYISKVVDTDRKIRVQDVIFIPSHMEDRDRLIKEAILNYGAASVSVNFTRDDDCFNTEKNSMYNPYSVSVNHEVAVVGWDDNYSKENFLITPPGDGAWIVKNSFGSNILDEGYYYLSYYDKSFLECSLDDVIEEFAIFFVFNNTINYKTNYQTDIYGLYAFNPDYKYYSTMYTALYNESLAAVGTYFNESGVDYEFKIYVNDKQVLIQNGTNDFAGYKTIILDKYIPVKEGDTFKVVFKSNNLPFQVYSRQHCLENLSWISADGENWYDVTEVYDTVCLKVYTVETAENNDSNNTPQPKPPAPKVKPATTENTKNAKKITQSNTHTIRLAGDNTIVYTGNSLTLEALNRIFDINFTNGQLLVYIDGVLVFNGTTTDDITMIIMELLDKYLGEHEIKVVFTDSQNQTNTYKENVIIG